MTTFKHGDRVTCEIDGIKIKDARISIDGDGTPFICQNIIMDGIPTDDKLGYTYSWALREDFTVDGVTNLKLAGPKQLEDIEVGDVLLKSGVEYPVLMRSGEVVVYEFESARGVKRASGNLSISELKYKGYTVKQEETKSEPVKMTVAQVAEKLGHEVEIVK